MTRVIVRVSVVIPAFNNEDTLDETIRSVLGQSGVDLELVIADHASSDHTRAVAERFADDERVTLLDAPAGGGASRNWNRVTDAATGDVVKLVCGDDVVRPGALARQARLLLRSGAVLTACRRDVTDASGKTVIAGWGLAGIARPMDGSIALRRAVRAGRNLFGEPASVMMRRGALADAGGWDGRLPYVIDLATYARVLRTGGFVPDTHVGATFRLSQAQWSVDLEREQAAQVRAFHDAAHTQWPEVISDADRRIGNARAAVMASARRGAYRVLKGRMS